MAKLLFSGDFCPRSNKLTKDFFKDINPLIKEHDLHITNLECPITKSEVKIKKTGPALKSDPSSIMFLKEAGVNVACLANNHIYDFGKTGILDTLDICKINSIEPIGIINRKDKDLPFHLINIKGEKIGIVNYCEHEFSVRPFGEFSANGFSYESALKTAKTHKNNYDAIIAVYHGGNEYYEYPSPGLKKRLQFLIDAGYDAVIAHHTHIISGYEIYENKPIFYGLGNFYFPLDYEPDCWFTGMLISLDTNSLRDPIIYFVNQNKDFNSIKLLSGNQHKHEIKRVNNISRIIADEKLLQENWDKFVIKRKLAIKKNVLNLSKFRRILIKAGLTNKNLKGLDSEIISILNLIRCESHRELVIDSMIDVLEDDSII